MQYIFLILLTFLSACSSVKQEQQWTQMSYVNDYAQFECNSGAMKLNPGSC